MATNNYHFVTHWRMRSTCEEITEILHDASGLTRWWPSVYLDVRVLDTGDERGIGRVVGLYTKGWLPYTLRWSFRVTAVEFPRGFALQASGDFVGTGVWTFEQEGADCIVAYDWRISAEKPLLRRLSWLLRGIFSANHHWAMRKGFESLQLELRRRRGETGVPAPPRASWPHG